MSSLLDELEDLHVFSEEIESHVQGKSENNQVITRPRESSLMVRKPTKRRLVGSKTVKSPRKEVNLLHINTESRVLNIISQNDSHEDEPQSELPSVVSLSTDKALSSVGVWNSERDIKDKNQHGSTKDSKFRASRFQHIMEKSEVNNNSSLHSVKLEDPSSVSFHEKKGRSGTDSPPKRKSWIWGSKHSLRSRHSLMGIDEKHLRAINDKAEYMDVVEQQNNEATDRRQLRGLLKKYAAKRRRTFEMSDLLKKLKQSQTLPILTRVMTRTKDHMSSLCSTIGRFCRRILQPINPNGVMLNIWETMILIIMVYELIAIPIEMAFDFGFSEFFFVMDWIETSWFFVDILLNFHTAYSLDGTVVTRHREIASYYLGSWFLADLIAFLPIRLTYRYNLIDGHINLFSLIGLLRVLKLLKIIKVFRIGQAFSRLKDFVNISGEMNGVMRLVRLWVTIAFLIHWVACFWHLLGTHPLNHSTETWILMNHMEYAGYSTRYIKSLYWATATLLTVGYGDIVAVNSGEEAYSIFVMLLGSAVVGFSMNQIGNILQQINSETNYKEKKFNELQKFMEKNEIDPKLQIKAKQYIEFKLEHERTMRETDKAVLESLSQSLRDQMLKQINGKVMKNSEFFQKSFGSNFLTKLAMLLDEQLLAPDEYIYHENELTDFSLYFIARGKVEISLQKYNLPLDVINKDFYFGELSFFTGGMREASAKTLTFCSIFSLSLSKFYEALGCFPTDREMYYVIRDQANLRHDYSKLGTKCQLCDDKNHFVQNCPLTHFVADKQTIIQRYIQDLKEFGEKYQRRPRTRFHALARKVDVDEAIERVNTLKNQGTASMTEVSGTLNHIRKSKKQVTSPDEIDDDELMDNTEITNSVYQTLVRIKDEDTGVVRLVKPNKAGTGLDSKFDLTRSTTLKPNGAARLNVVRILENGEKHTEEVIFDQVRNYEIYFPHNNVTKVIEQIEYAKGKKKTLKIDLNLEHDVALFKMKLGKIFDRSRKKLGTGGVDSPRSMASSRRSIMPVKKSQPATPTSYVKKRSKSVKEDIIPPPAVLLKKLSSKRKSSWTPG